MRKLILLAILCITGNFLFAADEVRYYDSVKLAVSYDSITSYFYYARISIRNQSDDTLCLPVCQGFEFKGGSLHQYCGYIPARETAVIMAKPMWDVDCNTDTVVYIAPHSSITVRWAIRNNSLAERPQGSLGLLLLRTAELRHAGSSADYCSLRSTYLYYTPVFSFPKGMKDKKFTTAIQPLYRLRKF